MYIEIYFTSWKGEMGLGDLIKKILKRGEGASKCVVSCDDLPFYFNL